jgi:putative FmdB family regulatory protein
MPIYEYRCEKCGHEFEREQRITEPAVKRCPSCKSQKAKRLISNTSFVLKGAGWYKDLYSSPKPGKSDSSSGDAAEASDTSAKGEAASKSDAGAKSEAKTESKGAAKEKKKGAKARKSAA